MNWATDSAWMTTTRRAAFLIGLGVIAAGPGCAGMNPFRRAEPPMLGTSNPATGNATRDARSVTKGEGSNRPQISRDRPPATNDLYAQSFGRTRPRAVDPPDVTNEVPDPEASTLDPAGPTEEGVRTTTIATSSAPQDSLGVSLRPPVALRASSHSTSPPADGRPDRSLSASPTTADPREDPSSSRRDEAQAAPSTTPRPTSETVIDEARTRLDGLATYQVLANRQERIGGTLQEPEDVVLSIRRRPFAVRIEWREGSSRGREVLYSEKETNGMLQVNVANSAIPIPRLSMRPDSPLILRTSRHPITQAGFDNILVNLKKTIEENKAGDESHGRISYGGIDQPESLDHPCHKIVRVTANGETWHVFFDPGTMLPAMVEAKDSDGDLLERYLFRDVRPDPKELAAADAFDPDLRWGPPKGLLTRMARGPAAKKPQTEEAH